MPTHEDYAIHNDGLLEAGYTGQPLENLCWGCDACGERGETVHDQVGVLIGMVEHMKQVEQLTHSEHLEHLSMFKVLKDERLEKVETA